MPPARVRPRERTRVQAKDGKGAGLWPRAELPLAKLLPNTSWSVRCAVRPNKPRGQSVERRKADGRAKSGELEGAQKPSNPPVVWREKFL